MRNYIVLFFFSFLVGILLLINYGFAFNQPSGNPSLGTGATLIRSGENIGIGTIPATRLHVHGVTDDFIRLTRAGQAQAWDMGVGQLVSPGSFFIARAGVERVFNITSAGNIGIGTGTPATRLDVAGTVRMTGFQLGTTATAGHVLTANASGVGTWTALPSGLPTGTTGQTLRNDGTSWVANSMLTNTGTRIGINTASPLARVTILGEGITSATQALNVGNSAGTSMFFVRDDGNVGIGTTGPAGRLDVADSFYTGVGRIDVRPQDGANEGGQIDFLGAGTNPRFIIDNWGGRLRFVRTSPDGLDVMTILQSGNVGIGTTSPTAPLTVVGNVIAATNTHDACVQQSWTCLDAQSCATGTFMTAVERGANSGAGLCGSGARQWYQMRITCCAI